MNIKLETFNIKRNEQSLSIGIEPIRTVFAAVLAAVALLQVEGFGEDHQPVLVEIEVLAFFEVVEVEWLKGRLLLLLVFLFALKDSLPHLLRTF